jgi:hypothetical protein
MCRSRSTFQITKRIVIPALHAAFALLWVVTLHGQATTRRSGGSTADGPYPRLPGAVTKAPEGLDGNSPFDIKKAFLTLARDRNSAPLYLDAFFEFGDEMVVCFPEGPERDRRLQAAKDRLQRYQELEKAIVENPMAVSANSIDEVIKLYDTGFRKLAETQRREQCVFESGLGFGALPPHIQAARQVTRITSLKVRRALENRNFDEAIRNVETVLRLARDLEPRGGMINQLVVVAISQVVCVDMVSDVLRAPGLRIEHCDRLLRALTSHESKSIDGYSEGFRQDYLATRVTLRDLVRHQSALADQLGLKSGDSVVKALVSMMGVVQADRLATFPDDADAQIARTSSAKLAIKVRELGRYYGALLELIATPYAKRIAQATALKLADGDDILSRLLTMMTPSVESYIRALARGTATIHATECLVVIRRWQSGHRGGLPANMASALANSPLKAVPIDPYDGRPMRFILLDGQPVVYSVGRDGKDDGGRIDSDRDQRPAGDLIYRMTPTATGR